MTSNKFYCYQHWATNSSMRSHELWFTVIMDFCDRSIVGFEPSYVSIAVRSAFNSKPITAIQAKSTKIIFACLCGRCWFRYGFKHLWFCKGNKMCFSGVVFLGWKQNQHIFRWLVCWQTGCLLTFLSANYQHKMVMYSYVGK